MFCNRCGRALYSAARFCPACGERVLPGPAFDVGSPLVTPSSRVRRHIGLLAALWMANGLLRLLEVFAFTLIGPVFWPGVFSSHNFGFWPYRWSVWPFSIGLAWLALLFGLFGVVHLLLAWGLQERKPWARPLGLAIGFLALVRFPLGTALGIYTLWVLLPEPSAHEFEQIVVP